jgi:tRNA threonylcarbamoyladenosine biosynthesis protein TsaB
MKLLALDSSGLVASVAVTEDDNLIGEYTVNYKKTHSQTLLPMLDAVASMIDLDLETVDAIAIAKGPGSFTGLRIGSATAKGLGLALDKPIVEIPTVDGLAYNLWGAKDLVCPLMDARRGQTYTGIYEFAQTDGVMEMKILKPQCAVDIHEILTCINELGRPVIFLGDGVPVFADAIKETLQVSYTFAPPHLNKQRAGAVAALAAIYMKQGKTVPAGEHQPDYLRLSQAERERREKEKRLPGDAGV